MRKGLEGHGLVERADPELTRSHGGSIYEVGGRFQSCRINDLELVDLICPRWNPLTSWMRQIEDFQRAA